MLQSRYPGMYIHVDAWQTSFNTCHCFVAMTIWTSDSFSNYTPKTVSKTISVKKQYEIARFTIFPDFPPFVLYFVFYTPLPFRRGSQNVFWYEAEEAMNPHSVGASKHPSRGPSKVFLTKIYLPWECLKPTKLEFATLGPVVAEKRQGLQGTQKHGKSVTVRTSA